MRKRILNPDGEPVRIPLGFHRGGPVVDPADEDVVTWEKVSVPENYPWPWSEEPHDG